MNEPLKSRKGLTNDAFAVLVALASGEQIGSEIQSRVVGDSVGVYIRSSTLYDILHRLVDTGLAHEQDKYYKLTERGWKRLESEARVMDSLVGRAKQRIVMSGRGRW